MNNYIEEISNSIDYDSNKLNKINNHLYITNKEKEILEKYDINYKNCFSMDNLIYLVEDYLNDSYEELPDLEAISIDLAERNYYMNTSK